MEHTICVGHSVMSHLQFAMFSAVARVTNDPSYLLCEWEMN